MESTNENDVVERVPFVTGMFIILTVAILAAALGGLAAGCISL